jgi:predicted permease
MSDLRYAFRQLLKSPAFTLIAVLSLALGIGANTALFSLIDDVLLRSLPVKAPQELVLLRWLSARPGMYNNLDGTSRPDPATGLITSTSTSYFVFERLRDQPGPFSDLFAFVELQQLNVGIDHAAEIARGQLATGGYFAGLGVNAVRGRILTADDDRPEAPPAAVISWNYWQRRFGGSDTAIGKVIDVNHVAVTVVGVTPPGFNGALQLGRVPDLTLPMALDARFNGGRQSLHQSSFWWIQIMGRLKPGVTAAAAQAQVEPAFIQAARDGWVAARVSSGPSPKLEERNNPRLRLVPGGQGMTETRRDYAQPLRILMGIVGIVLLIACVNVANLLLARGAGRAKEIAVRLSVGATRGRIVRQLVLESLLLSTLGGLAGILVAWWGRAALLQLSPIEGTGALALNVTVLGFTFGAAVLTGLLFGLVPAWQATRVDLNSALKGGGGGTTAAGRFALRRVLMIAQVALSVVLLVGAGLFLRTLHNLRTAETGFNRENLMLFRVDAFLSGYKGPDGLALFDRLTERLARLPGVKAVTFSRHGLLSGGRRSSSVTVPGLQLPAQETGTSINLVNPGFLAAMQIPLLLGRDVSARDTATSPPVAVVNEAFVRRFFPEGGSPIGRTFNLGNRSIEVVGVARDAAYASIREPMSPAFYQPIRQDPATNVNFALRTAGDPAALGTAIRAAVREIDANLPIFELRTQEEQVTQLVARERLFALLSAFFAALALVLTCIGLYGLLAHQVTMRTREIGIRMALGAQLRSVVSLVLGEGLSLAIIGVVIGLLAAWSLTGFVAKMLFGVPPTDLPTFAGVGGLLLAIAALACALPARRAAKVDPMQALRAE